MAFSPRHRMHWGYASALISIAGTVDFLQIIFSVLLYGSTIFPYVGVSMATFFTQLSLAVSIGGFLLISGILIAIGTNTTERLWFFLPNLVLEINPLTSFAPLLTPIVIRVVFLVWENDRIYNVKHGTSTTQVVAARSSRTVRSTPHNNTDDSESSDWN